MFYLFSHRTIYVTHIKLQNMTDINKNFVGKLGRKPIPVDRKIGRLILYMPLGMIRQFEGVAMDAGCTDREIYSDFGIKVIAAGLAALRETSIAEPNYDDFSQIPAHENHANNVLLTP